MGTDSVTWALDNSHSGRKGCVTLALDASHVGPWSEVTCALHVVIWALGVSRIDPGYQSHRCPRCQSRVPHMSVTCPGVCGGCLSFPLLRIVTCIGTSSITYTWRHSLVRGKSLTTHAVCLSKPLLLSITRIGHIVHYIPTHGDFHQSGE
jgi:hypothetical protein